jgi:hypothetical protein
MLRSFVQPFDIFNCTCIWLDDERWMNGTLYVLNLDAWSLVRSVLLIFFSFLCCIFCFVCLCGLRTQCCQFLWIVDSWLPLQFLWIVDSWLPLQFLWIVDSWLPCPFSFSGLWILDCPFSFSGLWILDCPFSFSGLWILDCPFSFSLTFIVRC